MKYEKPLVILSETVAESVYAASGSTSPKCNSQYMNGVYHAPDYSNDQNYISRFGCNGCPAFRPNGCALQLETYWGSYDTDNGNRMPSWERSGNEPYSSINWNN